MSRKRSLESAFGGITNECDASSSFRSNFTDSHNEKWPASVTAGRISVSPPESISKIPEMSPPRVLDHYPSKEEAGDAGTSASPFETSCRDSPDGSGVYQSTTTPVRRQGRRRGSSTSSQADLLPPSATPTPKGPLGWFRRQLRTWQGMSLSRRHWLITAVLLVVTLTSSFAVCLFPPFFPEIAQKKGASTSVFGAIIGTNCLVAFLVTPVVGKNLDKFGVKFCFVMGAFSSGCCCILSGFLEWFPPGWEFILEAVLIRAVHACCNAFVITSTFAFIVAEFPDHIATMFAMTRTTMNLAQMFGPVIGGALYELGGFKLPFFVLGSVQILAALLSIWALPSYRPKTKTKEQEAQPEVTIKDVAMIPGMWISFCTFVFSTMSNGFLSITLEALVLRKFNISHLHVGFLFGLKDGANSFSSMVWGCLSDRPKNLRPIILVASVLAAASFVLIGPFPGLPLQETHTIVVIALVINGVGIGGQQVAGVVHAMQMASSANLPDDAATHGFVAGLWSSLSGAGRFISRAGSGYVVSKVGFRYCTMIAVFLHGIVFLVTSSFMVCEKAGRCLPSARSSPEDGPTRPHCPDCCLEVCVCNAPRTLTVIGTNTPSESITTKAIIMPIPGRADDMENSMTFGSIRSNACTPPFARASTSSIPNLPSPDVNS